MAKKPFGWIRDAEEPVVPSPYRPTRYEAAEDVRRADALLEPLANARPAELDALDLPDALREALDALARIPARNHGAHKRQTGRVRGLLRDLDLDALEAALGAAATASAARDEALALLARWRDRMVDEGDEAVNAFVDLHPSADRQHLRVLARNAGRHPPGSDAARKAGKALMAAVRAAAGVA
ncbi:MAG: DUF615 domain-containing protein [Myxococcales bacterium]|nr:DUF615 domain-containing protein [Myxococcales bacterium]